MMLLVKGAFHRFQQVFLKATKGCLGFVVKDIDGKRRSTTERGINLYAPIALGRKQSKVLMTYKLCFQNLQKKQMVIYFDREHIGLLPTNS